MIMIIQQETLFCNNDIVRGYKNLTWCAFSLLTTSIHKSASNETSYYMHNTSVIADYNNKRTRTIRFDKILKITFCIFINIYVVPTLKIF